jgi:hypothetical protein
MMGINNLSEDDDEPVPARFDDSEIADLDNYASNDNSKEDDGNYGFE